MPHETRNFNAVECHDFKGVKPSLNRLASEIASSDADRNHDTEGDPPEGVSARSRHQLLRRIYDAKGERLVSGIEQREKLRIGWVGVEWSHNQSLSSTMFHVMPRASASWRIIRASLERPLTRLPSKANCLPSRRQTT